MGEESRESIDWVGGVNDPWIYYLMSSSGDANSTAEQQEGLLGSWSAKCCDKSSNWTRRAMRGRGRGETR